MGILVATLVATLSLVSAPAVGAPGHSVLPSPTPSAATPAINNGQINSIVQVGSTVVVGGTFTSVTPPGGGAQARSYVIAFDAKRFGKNPPKSWADFWDVKKYPGKRTLYKWMSANLECALLADGVAPDKLYPLDVDRALRKIEELMPHVVTHWSTGAESQQLLRDGEASMGAYEDAEGKIKRPLNIVQRTHPASPCKGAETCC